MHNNKLRLITYISLFLIIAALKFFTNVSNDVIISIAIIMVFLILFTFVFNTEGPKALKIFVIVFSFVVLPLFILYYLGVLNSFSSPLEGIVIAIVVILLGVTAIFTITKLEYVEIYYDRIDEG